MLQHPSVLMLLQLISSSYALKELTRDYFVYKNVARVVGFSCDETDVIFQTIRTLNDANISASVKTPGSKFDFPRFMRTDAWKLGVFVDIRCTEQRITDIFNNASEHVMFSDTYSWLVIGTDLSNSLKSLNDSAFSIVTDVVVCIPNGDSYDFYDVYNHCKYRGGSLTVTKCGKWHEDFGLNLTLQGSKISRRWNFQGLTVKIVSLVRSKPKDMPLIKYMEDESTKPADSFGRFSYSLMKHLPEMFNFTADLSTFTSWQKNDTNGPLMRALKDGTADLGCYAAKITQERLNYARVSLQVWPFRSCFMFRATPSTKIKISTILRPLSATTWYTTALVLLIIFLLFSLILRLESFDRNNQVNQRDTILMIVAAICQQGFPFDSEQLAGRIAFLQITMFGLLIYNCYSAAIVSARLSEPFGKMNDSLYSLVRSNMKLGAHYTLYFNFLLSDPNWEVQYFKRYWEATVPESQRFLSKEEGIQKILKGGFAYHIDPNEGYPLIHRYFDGTMICHLTEVHLWRSSQLAIFTSHNGQFSEISKIGLLRIISAGLRVRQVWHWTSKKPFCQKDILTGTSVTIYEAAPMILLLLCGVILSLIICLIETIMYQFRPYEIQPGLCRKNKKKITKPLR